MSAEELINELPKGLLKWYRFKKGGHALYITAESELDHALAEALTECGLETKKESCFKSELDAEKTVYDYVVIGDAISYVKTAEIVKLLSGVFSVLKPDGRLLLCADNRLAIRYFCGDRDPFTGRNFDGIENYKRVNPMDIENQKGRMYAKSELIDMLKQAGFMQYRFYAVFPELTCPKLLFSEDYVPVEELKIRIFPQYRNPDTVFLEEENLYTSLIENNMLHTMANGFFIECPLDGIFADADQITVSMERGKENALCTIITHSGKVVKVPAYNEGKRKIENLIENNHYLKQHGVRMIEATVVDDSFVMPYLEGMPLSKYFGFLAGTDQQKFFNQFDRLWKLILSSSDHVPFKDVNWEHFNPWWDEEKDEKAKRRTDRSKWRKIAFGSKEEREALGPVLKRGYLDLVLLNGFAIEDDFVFYDQETYVSNLPAKAIMLRNIDFLYHGDTQLRKLIPREELLERYNMEKYQQIYYDYIWHFLTRLRNDDLLKDYYEAHRRNDEVVHSNRQRMNYSAAEYQRLFIDIFKNTDNKKLYLFGSGNFTKKFLALYKEEYEIAGILDNDSLKWSVTIDGIPIMTPLILQGMDASTYKVIICIKNYTGVLRQVKRLGATNIGIYDTNMEYPGKQKPIIVSEIKKGREKKKYHVGYVAGVFDLFHIGHLNLLRRAKEQCDYLIVGVVTDEGVKKNKNTESFICFEERLEIVSSCKYVDQAIGIPLEYYDTKDAYLKFQFDVQFSGSDYSNDPVWKKKQEFLRSHGAELVFFPYTESTSSTKIKEMIDRKLM